MAEHADVPRAAVLTVSDGVAARVRNDDTGAAIAQRLADDGYEIVAREVVADERDAITAALRRLAGSAHLLVTNGGTGLGPRDVTPEATAMVVDRTVPGLAEAMRAAGRAHTPMADLSRGMAGSIDQTLVVNLPGSPRGAVESFDAVRAVLAHALALLAGDTAHGQATGAEPAAGGRDHHGHGHDHHDHAHSVHDHGRPAHGREHPTHGGESQAHDHHTPDGHRPHHGDRGIGDVPGRPVAAGDRFGDGDAAGVHAELARRVAAGERAVLATAVRTEGEPPCTPGMAVLVGGEPHTQRPLAGTLGCADFDEAAVADAPDVLADGTTRLARYSHAHGAVEVQLQPFVPAPPLVVLGATPVAAVLLRWGAELGWSPVLVESRPDRVDADMRQAAVRVVDHVGALSLDARAVAVHTDHDAPDVADQLAALLRAGVRRVEMMGSRRHAAPVLDQLADTDVGEAVHERVRRPAGLDLGGRTPPEIALAILAALVADRHGRSQELS